MKNNVPLLVLLGATIFLSSWTESVETALSKSGVNRQELEKVLLYFQKDSDSLKIRAAEFLIARMQYYYSSYKEKGDSIREYPLAGQLPIEKRNQIFKKHPDNTTFSLLDLCTIRADYLINRVSSSMFSFLTTF